MKQQHTGPGAKLAAGLQRYAAVPGAALVDVREDYEYAAGHVPDSVNWPGSRLGAAVPPWPKTTPLFVYCVSGMRSARACTALRAMGYEAVNIGGVQGYAGPLER